MRSLILAGGGLKVAYQAGCLQVLLDELNLTFDHVDGASGGCFNAAMMANGMTGTQIANAWRNMNPLTFSSLNYSEYWKGPYLRSIGTSAGARKAFKEWGLNWNTIRQNRGCVYTFNHFNFTKKCVVPLENRYLDEDYLVASVSLPVWYSPVLKGADWIFDAVYCTDGNVGEAVRRGADEIWAIWTVSDLPEYRSGWIAEYFHIIETVADAKFKDEWDEIAAVNAAIDAYGAPPPRAATDLRLLPGYAIGGPGVLPPPGRKKIAQHLIQQEVPMHYVLIWNGDRVAAAVELGVRDARAYAGSLGRQLTPSAAPRRKTTPMGVGFTETMRGFFMPGETDYVTAEREGKAAGNRMTVRLTIASSDIDDLLHSPEHRCSAKGSVVAPKLNAQPMPADGSFNLFVNDESHVTAPARIVPAHKKMLYDISFAGYRGETYTLVGRKIINDRNGFTLWPDTTTLYCDLFVQSQGAERTFFGAGIIHVQLLDFLEELTTFNVPNAPNACERKKQLLRFGAFWLGQIWDVYWRAILDYGPF